LDTLWRYVELPLAGLGVDDELGYKLQCLA